MKLCGEDTVEFRKTISLEEEREHADSLLVSGHQLYGKLKNLLLQSNVHTDSKEAMKLGFTSPIVSADHLYCVICNYLHEHFGSLFNTGGIVETKFLKPVYVGEEFICIFKARQESSQNTIVDYCFKNDRDDVLLSGSVIIDLSPEKC